MATNAVRSLFDRLGLSAAYGPVGEAGIEKIVQLRSLVQDADRLAQLIPDVDARKKICEALSRTSQESTQGATAVERGDDNEGGRGRGGRGGGRGGRGGGDRKRTVCRDFFQGGCEYGDDCRYSHDPEAYAREGIETKETYTEEITIPSESVKLLLAAKDKNASSKINEINKKCGTTNSRIEKAETYLPTVTFTLRGTKDGVAKAKAEIEHHIGITSQRNREARFNYTQNELEYNRRSVAYLLAANAKNQGTSLALSENVLKQVASTFRFQEPPKVSQFWLLADKGDKEKFERLVPLVRPLQGIQAIVFTDATRVEEMAKRSKQTAEAFGVKNPQFVHRKLDKAERMKALEAFKNGEVGENGIRQRLLVTNEDYAKLARKTLIPYVNLVVHFAMPRNKEMYLHQTNCTGRGGHTGLSILFVHGNDSATHKELESSIEMKDLSLCQSDFDKAAAELKFDTVDAPLSSPEADPPANWAELLEKEKAEKAAKKAAKAA